MITINFESDDVELAVDVVTAAVRTINRDHLEAVNKRLGYIIREIKTAAARAEVGQQATVLIRHPIGHQCRILAVSVVYANGAQGQTMEFATE